MAECDDFYGFCDSDDDITDGLMDEDNLDESSSSEEHHESICYDSSDSEDEDNDSSECENVCSECSDSDDTDDETKFISKETKWSKISYFASNQNYKNTESNIRDHKINLPPDTAIVNPQDAFFLLFQRIHLF